MDQAITHLSHRTPRNLGMRYLELSGQVLHCFADNFQAAHKRTAQRLIGYKSLIGERPTLIEEVLDFRENMPQIVMRLEGHPLPRPRCVAR